MNKIAKNYIYNLIYQLLVILVPLITTPYIARTLGAKGVGTFSYTNSIVQYFILFGCIGLNLYGQREIAYVQHDKKNRSIVFWELLILRIITISISIMVYLFTVVRIDKYSTIFIIMSLEILASLVDISWFFQGIEDFKKIVIRNLIVKIAGVLLIFLFIKNVEDLNLYVLIHSAVLFTGNLSTWIYIPKLVSRVSIHSLSLRRHIKPTLVLFLPQIATSVYTVLDKTMIGFITGIEEEVAYYEQGQKIVKIVLTLVTSLSTVMMPRIANLFKQNNLEKINDYIYKSFRFVCLLAFPMMFGLMAISSNIVPWFFGPGYEKVVPNMMIISPIVVFISLSSILGTQYLLPLRRQKQYTLSVLIGCIVNCTLNLLMIPRFLSLGAAVATIFAEGSVTLTHIIFTRKDFDYKAVFKDNAKYFVFSLAMFVIVYPLARFLSASIMNTLVCVIIGVSVYLMCLLFSKDKIIYDLFFKVKRMRM